MMNTIQDIHFDKGAKYPDRGRFLLLSVMTNKTRSLSGNVALITGGGTGLGFGIADAFVKAGARVVITGRREDVLKQACDELGEAASYIMNDIADLSSIHALVETVETTAGPIDILVNNAGINQKKAVLDVTDEEFMSIIQTNLCGVFSLTREVAQKMKTRNRGSIIMITSMAAMYGIPHIPAYTASKAGLLGLTKTLAVDFAQFGIRVNSIAPGFIDSPMLRKAFDSDPDRAKRVLDRTPMHSLGKADDVAQAALFLASDAAAFVTGVNLPVDGGNSIGF
jgi:gluconate 5-dehydrogenase